MQKSWTVNGVMLHIQNTVYYWMIQHQLTHLHYHAALPQMNVNLAIHSVTSCLPQDKQNKLSTIRQMLASVCLLTITTLNYTLLVLDFTHSSTEHTLCQSCTKDKGYKYKTHHWPAARMWSRKLGHTCHAYFCGNNNIVSLKYLMLVMAQYWVCVC